MREQNPSAALSLLSRIVAAIGGAYVAANLLTILLVQLLPGPRAHAALAGMTLSFGVYALLIIWVFSASSARRAWLNLGGLSACCALGLWLLL